MQCLVKIAEHASLFRMKLEDWWCSRFTRRSPDIKSMWDARCFPGELEQCLAWIPISFWLQSCWKILSPKKPKMHPPWRSSRSGFMHDCFRRMCISTFMCVCISTLCVFPLCSNTFSLRVFLLCSNTFSMRIFYAFLLCSTFPLYSNTFCMHFYCFLALAACISIALGCCWGPCRGIVLAWIGPKNAIFRVQNAITGSECHLPEVQRDFSGAALQTRSIGHGVTKKELVLERFKVQKCTPFGSVLGGQKGVISLSSA